MMNEVLECLTERRSVRSYSNKMVEDEKIAQIVEAGKYAPCGMGMQPTMMVVVKDAQMVKMLSEMNAKVMGAQNDPFYGAPVVVIVFADTGRATYVEDGSLVMGNLLNAAHSVGVDSCWIHRAKEMFASEEGIALKEKWGVPAEYEGIGNCILGYGDTEYPQAKPRKENFVVYA